MLIKPLLQHFFFIFLLCAASLSSQVQAEEKLCVVTNEKSKKRYVSAQSQALPKVIAIFKKANVKLTTFNTPTWARSFEMAKNGQCLILGLWRNSQRDKIFNYSAKPIFTQNLGLYVNAEKKLPADKNIIMAVERGSYLPEKLKNKSWQVHYVDSIRQSLKMLYAQRVDVVYGDLAYLDYLILNNKEYSNTFSKVLPVVENKKAYLAIAKSHPNVDKLLSIFDKAIAEKSNGAKGSVYHLGNNEKLSNTQ